MCTCRPGPSRDETRTAAKRMAGPVWNPCRREVRQRRAASPGYLALVFAGCMLTVGIGQAADGIGPAGPTAASKSDGLVRVEMDGELVSVRARNAALADLLREMARQSGIILMQDGPPGESVSVTLHRLSLPEAIARVLRHHNFVLQLTPNTVDQHRIGQARRARLWVFSDGPVNKPHAKMAATQHTPDPPTVVSPLWGELRSDDSAARLHAIRQLRGLPAEEAVAHLSEALADEDARVRRQAVFALEDLGTVDAIAALNRVLDDADPMLRAEVVRILGRAGDETRVGAIERSLTDESKAVREAAVETLADVGGQTAAQSLAVALSQEDASLREDAVDALAEIGGATAVRLLQQALSDQNASVRSAAAEALADLSDQDR